MLALTAVVAAAAPMLADAQAPPPPGMVRTAQSTMSCPRSLPRFDVTIASHGGPLAIDAGESSRSYASLSLHADTALIRTTSCRALRRPSLDPRGLGPRSNLNARFYEVRQFSCALRGALVSHVAILRDSARRLIGGRVAFWSVGGRKLIALVEVSERGRAWLRVSSACDLRYSR